MNKCNEPYLHMQSIHYQAPTHYHSHNTIMHTHAHVPPHLPSPDTPTFTIISPTNPQSSSPLTSTTHPRQHTSSPLTFYPHTPPQLIICPLSLSTAYTPNPPTPPTHPHPPPPHTLHPPTSTDGLPELVQLVHHREPNVHMQRPQHHKVHYVR